MENKPLNEKESLELIARMIQNTHRNLESDGGKIMLIYGYITLLTSLLVYFTVGYTRNPYYYFLWFLIPVIGQTWVYRIKKSSLPKVTTYIDQAVSHVWLVAGISVCLSACAAFFTAFHMPILFVVALMINAATAINGLIIRFKTLTFGGFAGIVLSFSLLLIRDINGIPIFGAIFLLCMIIPGHVLQHAEKKKRLKPENHV